MRPSVAGLPPAPGVYRFRDARGRVLSLRRLDSRPATPGLRPVHAVVATAGVDHFGPYLGGEKVRTAVAGMHRVRPLAYTGTGLTGAERDLADRRGVGPGDRDRYVTALAAILRRDPPAVESLRHDLSTVRERAAAPVAFERAARVQDELDAVDWITSPQRVTSPEPVDSEVAGWADGILVRFQIRAGRVRIWTQPRCTADAARRHVAATPAGWSGFADRSAELAARLAG